MIQLPPWSPEIERQRGENRELVEGILACPSDKDTEERERLVRRFRERTRSAALRLYGVWNTDTPWTEENVFAVLNSPNLPHPLENLSTWHRNVPVDIRNNPTILQKVLTRNSKKQSGRSWFLNQLHHFDNLGISPSLLVGTPGIVDLLKNHYPYALYTAPLPPSLLSDRGFLLQCCHSTVRDDHDRDLVLQFLRKFHATVRSHRETMIEVAKSLPALVLDVCHESLKDDEVFALVVAQNSSSTKKGSLDFFSDRVRANRLVVEAFCRSSGECLECADPSLRRDETIVRLACLSSPQSLCHCLDSELQYKILDDKEFVLAMLTSKQEVIEYCWQRMSARVKEDRAVVIQALRFGKIGKYDMIPEEYLVDRSFWLEAFDSGDEARFRNVATFRSYFDPFLDNELARRMLPRITDDKSLFVAIAGDFPDAFQDRSVFLALGQAIIDDKEFVHDLLRVYGGFHDAKALARVLPATVTELAEFVRDTFPALLRDVEFFQELMTMECSWPICRLLLEIDTALQRDHPDVLLEIFDFVGTTDEFLFEDVFRMDDELWRHSEFVIQAIEASRGQILRAVPEEVVFDDDSVVLSIVECAHYDCAVLLGSPRLLEDPKFWLRVIATYPDNLQRIPSRLRTQDHLLYAAVKDPKYLCLSPGRYVGEDFERAIGLADYVRGRLAVNTAFVLFMSGLKDPTSPIGVLLHDEDTTRFLLEHIASYLELPRGAEYLGKLRQMSALLADWGL